MKKTIKIILALSLALLFNYSLKAQVTAGVTIAGDFSLSSGAVYGTSNYDYSYDIKIDTVSPGGPFAYVLGYTYPSYYILKYNSAGVFQSSATLGGCGGYNIHYQKLAITTTPVVAVYAAGSSYNSYLGRNELLFSKYDSDLNYEASTSPTLGLYGADFYDVAPGPQYLYICYYSTGSYNIGMINSSLLPSGSPMNLGAGTCERIATDNASNVYTLGWAGAGQKVTKFTSDLTTPVSSISFSSPTFMASSMAVDPVTQEVFLAGSQPVCDPYTGICDSWSLNLHSVAANFDPATISTVVFINPGHGDVRDIKADGKTNVSVLASVSNNGNNDYGVFVFSTGTINFKNSFFMDAGAYDEPNSLAVDDSSGVYVTGNSYRYGEAGSGYDIASVKFDMGNVSNRAPSLVWIGTTNYWSDGLDPEIGVSADTFTYKVKYQDPDNDAPQFVRVHIYKDGFEINNSPFSASLSTWVYTPADYHFGAYYSYISTGMPYGFYSYKFESLDARGVDSLPAKGYPATAISQGPQVGEGFIGNVSDPGGVTYANGSQLNPQKILVYSEAGKGDSVYGVSDFNGDAFFTRFSTGAGSVSISTMIKAGYDGAIPMGTPHFAGVIRDSSGNLHLLASHFYYFDMYKLDSNLNVSDFKSYDNSLDSVTNGIGENPLYAKAVISDKNDSMYVIYEGYTYSGSPTGYTYTYQGFGIYKKNINQFYTDPTVNPGGAVNVFFNSVDIHPQAIAADNSGNIFVTGEVQGFGKTKMLTAKFDSSANFISSVPFYSAGTNGGDTAVSLAADATGQIFVLGVLNNGQNNNLALLKYDNDLNLLNSVMFDAGNMESAASVTVDTVTGNIFVAGYSDFQANYLSNSKKILALKYDNNLVFKSSYTFGGNFNEDNRSYDIVLNSAGEPYLIARSDYFGINPVIKVRVVKPQFSNNQSVVSFLARKQNDSSPMRNIKFALVPSNIKGAPDAGLVLTGVTDSSGSVVFNPEKGLAYLISFSTPGYAPLMKDQISDPSGNFNKVFNFTSNASYSLSALSSPGSTVTVSVSNIYPGLFLMGEIYLKQTQERVAYGILRATDSVSSMEIHNVPNLTAGTYGIAVNIPGWLSNSISPGVDVPSNNIFSIDMATAMPPSSSYNQTSSTSGIYFSGFVGDPNGTSVNGARVKLYANCGSVGCDFSKETFSDVGGRFSMSGPLPQYPKESLFFTVSKSGYKVCQNLVCQNTMGPSDNLPQELPVTNLNFTLQPATYTLSGIIRYLGNPVPYARIAVTSDFDNYKGYDAYSSTYTASQWNNNYRSYPADIPELTAYTDGNGLFSMTGLSQGNILLEVRNPVNKHINHGPDEMSEDDNIRITISSAGAASPLFPPNNPCIPGKNWITDSSGTCKGVMPYVFDIGVGVSTNAKITGNIVFTTTYTVTPSNPLIISLSSSVTVGVFEDCKNFCPNPRNFLKTIYGTLTSNVTSYTVEVSSWNPDNSSYPYYWVSLLSNSWAKLDSFDNNANFVSTDTIIRNMTLVPAGSLLVSVKRPDGTLYTVSSGNEQSPYIEIRGQDVSYKASNNVSEDGTYELRNIPPGKYDIFVRSVSTETPYAPLEADNVVINTGKQTVINLTFKSGYFVQPHIFGLQQLSTDTWNYHIIAVPSGQQMNKEFITELFFNNPVYSFDYSTETANFSKIVMPQGQYDFYLVLGSMYCTPDDNRCPHDNYNQFANFIGKIKNVSIKQDSHDSNLGTASQPIPINIPGSMGQSEMYGWVKGDKIFTGQDFPRIFANFESEIMTLIPALMLYDTAGELRGFSNVMPDADGITGFMSAISSQDPAPIINTINNHQMGYYIWGLPPGKYTAVFANPNYPPVTRNITLPDNTVYNFDFDQADVAIGGLRGVVISSSAVSMPLAGAVVNLTGRIASKYVITDSSGFFTVDNLPTGVYKLEVSMDGFVKTGNKFSLGKDETLKLPDFYLQPSTSIITGKVFLSRFPTSTVREGVIVSAYDETQNVNNPQSYLPTIQDLTDENGAFELKGVLPGHNYKVSVVETGKKTFSRIVTALDGVTVMEDIGLSDLPPQIVIKLRRDPDSPRKVNVEINSPKELVSIPECKYNPGQVYDSSSAISLMLIPGANNSFIGQFTTSVNSRYYTVDVTVGDASKMEKSVVYDNVSNSKTEQYVQDTSLLGGSVYMDEAREEYSGLELDPGSLTQASTTTVDLDDLVGGFFRSLPNVRTMKTAKGDMTIADAVQNIMASDVYDIDLSNAQANKSFTLTLKYDKEKAINSGSLKVYQYDNSGQWKEVPGTYSVDPMLGTVSVDVDSLEKAYEGSSGGSTPLERKAHGMSVVSNGHYAPSSSGTSSQTGKFAVFTAKPDPNLSYAGTSFEVYNLPNPFNLKDKTVTNIEGTTAFDGSSAYVTRGTILKYHLPAGKSGNVKFVIYNIAGEKVRTIEDGARNGGYSYYSEWDGKNDKGENCASGVYFLMTYVNGEKAGRKPHKMAIIK